ncbi:SRPBCC family protein [Bordetella bronchiseptica]|uniref:SRPBCC family protein n=1 Tax=Bordetella bronchiseptica TaxID=518 RepID=UPI000460DCA3|nr:SRPBCC family protein [Bordetella bronchiseptica]KDC43587.1 polyketide cyclase/dehydrase and lipid transport [Bordetella bronchiseptica M435/02/3]KDD01682.1 polyketide cyclase/dehydrase and lipid transport [Bordetella bronchiseptica MBORD698]KDD07695.1 polyketide cyclase/dehydrase and lipid transport [Bordetella bronchiseptica MBORD681]
MSHLVYVSRVVAAPIERVWPHLRDFNGLSAWHPGVADSRLEEGGRDDAPGTVRLLSLNPSGYVRERLLMLDDAGRSLRYAIIETDLPMRDYVAGVDLCPVTEGGGTFAQWWADFDVVAGANRDEVARLVGEGVFAAGLQALDQYLRGRQA